MRAQPIQFMIAGGVREKVVNDFGDEFEGGVAGEARDDKARVGEAEVGEGGGVRAIGEVGGAGGGEKEECALVGGDRGRDMSIEC